MNSHDLEIKIGQLEAELILLQQKDKWQSMAIAECPEAIVITDINGFFEHVNLAFTAITGYTEQEVLGKSCSILKSNIHPDAFYADLWTTILAGHRWEGEICNKRKDNTLYWEKNSIAPIKNEQVTVS